MYFSVRFTCAIPRYSISISLHYETFPQQWQYSIAFKMNIWNVKYKWISAQRGLITLKNIKLCKIKLWVYWRSMDFNKNKTMNRISLVWSLGFFFNRRMYLKQSWTNVFENRLAHALASLTTMHKLRMRCIHDVCRCNASIKAVSLPAVCISIMLCVAK